jgi:hypothetical protein
MSWRTGLARFVGGDSHGSGEESIPHLQKTYVGLLQRSAQMRQHAEAAPNQLNQDELKRLAAEDEARARRVAEALASAGAASTAAPELPRTGAPNHWARLVQDLEAHRAAVRLLREQSIQLADSSPETAALLAELCVQEDQHAIRLRDLIARTDPQALN